MAQSIVSPAARIKRHYDQLLPGGVIIAACGAALHRWRKAGLIRSRRSTCSSCRSSTATPAILHLRHLAGSAVNPAAYCRARMRLPLSVYQTLLDYSAGIASGGCAPVFAAMRVLLVDATSSLTPDTRSIRKLFKQPASINPGCGFPMAKVLALFDAASGAILQPLIDSLFVHEASRVWARHPLLRGGDLLVGDRAFCSYVHLVMLHARSVFGLFRMHQKQNVNFRRGRKHGGRGQPTSRFVRKLGPLDQLVEWFKPEQKPKWMTKKQYAALPSSLLVCGELRYHLQAARNNAPASSPSPPRFWIQPCIRRKRSANSTACAGRSRPICAIENRHEDEPTQVPIGRGDQEGTVDLLHHLQPHPPDHPRRRGATAGGGETQSASSMHYAGWPTPATAMN